MKIAFVEWPEGLSVDHGEWQRLMCSIQAAEIDLLVTNELPFGRWIADERSFSEDLARYSIDAHERGLEALAALKLPAIISSRPIWYNERLVNEAFVLEHGYVRALHRKQYFPSEPGWYEDDWFVGDGSGFAVNEVLGIKVGILLCTEAMFNEHARAYGKQEASLIIIPRATGRDTTMWKTAAAMASLVSGAYVVSSNRTGRSKSGTVFGGRGFAYAPEGQMLTQTSKANTLQVFELDLALSDAARRSYPCYVSELN
ncbi:carbon-nitrogen hydrolase family protein [Asticcacaulis benevestitus]|uniref:CN hydrolase domain-containing protein n=1 Tax=Asticcacaulis benevestitus DSM 16100 = ATCC BAA-896 TaxID=1121022 RepID=V4NKV8_9CAUL|nr:carbon-nitrogen hydrolase family protein [Asticcacaulis benevestitus]ESQ82477.1 hypothetical protein ABENE_20905 [Asticcacaulis benevestitus DSM 16100 = ATCC BAA-896]